MMKLTSRLFSVPVLAKVSPFLVSLDPAPHLTWFVLSRSRMQDYGSCLYRECLCFCAASSDVHAGGVDAVWDSAFRVACGSC